MPKMSADDNKVPFTPLLRPLRMHQIDEEDNDDDELHAGTTEEIKSSSGSIQSRKEDNVSSPPPLCSVLNTIVDYCMMPPSALFEPEEYQQQQQPRRSVPVLRFFGPMLRRLPYPSLLTPSRAEPLSTPPPLPLPPSPPPVLQQSACLYVHGAFPYLLARPVAAGPDGSSHLECPWDSVSSVQCMVPVLMEALEKVLHETSASFAASMTSTNAGGTEARAASLAPPQQQQQPRLLRRITVVTGRGFYTYCPGPVAPFLRVEYYCPADRWKVKRCLEHGLSDLPKTVYHPLPLLPTEPSDKFTPVNESHDEDDVLRFNCYEAHIPYTMQVFKDWNLAGLSYIHVAATTGMAKFRHPLPNTIRSTARTNPKGKNSTSTPKPVLTQSAFVVSNTPLDYTWHDDLIVDSETKAPIPFKKVTSCDVELDICVSSILNVLDVMTELPDEWEERQQIHWRAVPSLREIWSQERRRMAKLLKPKDDFLSGTERTDDEVAPPPFTLNVKRDAPLSGARLAVDGMSRLVRVTEGLEENFYRVMRDIVERHAKCISQADAVLRTKLHHQAANDDSVSFADSRVGSNSDTLTPSHDEAMAALGALHELFETPPPRLDFESANVPSTNWEVGLSSSSYSQTPSNILNLTLSQACASSVEETPSSLQAEFHLSQSVERGDGIVDTHLHSIDNLIDPETLVPYETFGDEDDDTDQSDGDDGDADALRERKVEHMLSTLATQDYMLNPNKNEATLDDSSVESWTLLSGKAKQSRDLLFELDDDVSVDRQNFSNGFNVASNAPNESLSNMFDLRQQEFPTWHHTSNTSIECCVLPPRRGDVAKRSDGSVSLHPKQSCVLIPQWTSFMADFENLRTNSPKESWFPIVGSHGVNVCQVNAAPLRKTVVQWKKRSVKRSHLPDAERNTAKRSRSESENGKEESPRIQNNDEVEEAVWQLSQDTAHLLSQANKSASKQTPKTPDVASMTPGSSEPQQATYSGSFEGTCNTPFQAPSQQPTTNGIGNQGGRLLVDGGGDLKAVMNQTQINGVGQGRDSIESFPLSVSMMVIEIYVHCRTGRAGVNDSRTIAMTPVPDRDKVCSVVFVLCRDPGGGEPFEYLERGCIFTPIPREIESKSIETAKGLRNFASDVRNSLPSNTFGISAPLSVECVRDERQLLLRLASIVRWKDPDILLSWDTQGAGLGYLLQRGLALGKDACGDGSVSQELDMARLLGRTPTMSSDASRSGQQFEADDAGSAALTEMNRATSNKSKDSAAHSHQWKGSGLGTEWDERVGAGAAAASINGRLVFAAWKIIAEEVKHPNNSYLPAIVSLVLSKRIPFHDNLKLGQWYGHDRGRERWRVLHHKMSQAVACLQLFDALDVVGRSGEAARLSGVEFSQSFPGIRGSQYKVEGVLLRALKSLNSAERGSKKGRRQSSTTETGQELLSTESASQTQSPWKARRGGPITSHLPKGQDSKSIHELADRCYFFFSPSLQDTTRQEALEVQALTLEPQSGHQTDPVVVCDFTALYPSLMIAYNLCFSTCAGKLDYHATRAEMRIHGKTTGQVGPMRYAERITAGVFKYHIKSLFDQSKRSKDRAYVAPTGSVYVSETVVKGVLPQVLDEMLSTRAMLKKAAKQYRKHVPHLSKSVLRQLEARQLALKYVANVTYGYTSATFSGRCAMPLLADSIVECGRRTLSNAIKTASQWGKDTNGRWHGVEVLYGDTDSIFIRIPGRSVAEAFQFGEDFCRAVTDNNPPPVQLKLEKVYLGSMMQTKKKYCGLKFESKEQRRPEFEAKGIETIRRDQCALTQKVLRNSLVTLYRYGLDAVKSYLFRQWGMILSGSLPVSDFILTGRIRSSYRGGRIGPVQAVLARRLAEADPAKVVRHKERQSYVIVATPGVAFKLKDCVLTPMELLEQWDAYSIHFAYYITKHVNAALQRCLGLAPYFVDVPAWFDASPKPRHRIHFWPSTRSRQSTVMISSFFGSDKCSLCGRKCLAKSRSRAAVCSYCRSDPVTATTSAMKRLSVSQNEAHLSAVTCGKCNLCFEDAHTFATVRSATSTSTQSNILVTPLGNCTCIDCPVTFKRHQIRENELEALAICEALDLF